EVGIKVGPMGRTAPTWIAPIVLGIAWSIGLLLLQSFAWQQIRQLIPSWAIDVQTLTFAQPHSGTYESIRIDRTFSAKIYSYGKPTRWSRSGNLNVLLRRASSSQAVAVPEGKDFTSQDLLDFLKDQRIPLDVKTSAEANE